MGECRPNNDDMPILQSQRSIFYADSDSIRRRAHVDLLQVRKMQFPMEREIEKALVCSSGSLTVLRCSEQTL